MKMPKRELRWTPNQFKSGEFNHGVIDFINQFRGKGKTAANYSSGIIVELIGFVSEFILKWVFLHKKLSVRDMYLYHQVINHNNENTISK